VAACPQCGRENADDARFCSACGARLEAAPEQAREERKVVSVLFADLVGFTSRAERLDPEDVRATLSPYYAQLRRELERHGGTVEKFIGDAVMAVFGAPVAHEDDPERAVRAGLRIRDSIVEDGRLQVRIAITTGEALVTLDASPAEGEGMVAGDVVNTAARLQSAAPTNGVLVDETTQRATRQAIDYRDAQPVQAKGKSEPISVWEAREARSRFGIDVAQSGAAFVGRRRELDSSPTRWPARGRSARRSSSRSSASPGSARAGSSTSSSGSPTRIPKSSTPGGRGARCRTATAPATGRSPRWRRRMRESSTRIRPRTWSASSPRPSRP
jgi:class 3 adenylate cyclase